MRIIGGKYRSRIITWPDDAIHIRPTKDRIREAIFSALGDISGFTTLDLYAGSGAMGIEAISRGAYFSYFVDINPISIETVKSNINSLKIPNNEYLIMSTNDRTAINIFIKDNIKFDIVFLDPPYEEGQYQEIVDIIVKNNLLTDNGIIVMESNKFIEIPMDYFNKRKDYKYGEILVSILRR